MFITAAIWFSSAIISIPSAVEYTEYEVTHGNDTHINCGSQGMPEKFGPINGWCILIVTYVVPLIVMIVNYSRVVRFVIAKSRQVSPNDQPKRLKSSVVSKNKVKIIKMLVFVTIIFTLSWLPYFSLLIIIKTTGTDDSSHFDGPTSFLRIVLSTFSTVYNFILYIVYNKVFRDGFCDIYCGNCIRFATSAASEVSSIYYTHTAAAQSMKAGNSGHSSVRNTNTLSPALPNTLSYASQDNRLKPRPP